MAANEIDYTPRRTNISRSATFESDQWKDSEAAWGAWNLLSFDGGGIRGYWSLLVLNALMREIAVIEEGRDDNIKIGKAAHHSFCPEHWPNNVSQGLTREEKDALDQATDENERCQALQVNRRYLPCHYFDLICGSSTGSLIAIMLGRFRMPVADCLDEYRNLAGDMFGKPRLFTKLTWGMGRNKYHASNAERVFRNVAQRRCSVDESGCTAINFPSRKGVCKTFAMSIMCECSQGGKESAGSLYLLRSYRHMPRYPALYPSSSSPRTSRTVTGLSRISNPDNQGGQYNQVRRHINYGNAESFEVWQIARAATAAPFYFKAFDGPKTSQNDKFHRFKDGGITSVNNPTFEGTQEIIEMNGANSLHIVVSIGTARQNHGSSHGIREKLRNTLEFGNDCATVDRQVKWWAGHGGDFHYFRLNDESNNMDVELDECKPRRGRSPGSETFKKMENNFNAWAGHEDVKRDIWRCAVRLVHQRRARAENLRKWEPFAAGSKYTCWTAGCGTKKFSNKFAFKEHLVREHGLEEEDVQRREREDREVWRYQRAPDVVRDK